MFIFITRDQMIHISHVHICMHMYIKVHSPIIMHLIDIQSFYHYVL